MKKYFFIIYIISGCHLENNKSTAIDMIHDNCIADSAMDILSERYSINNIKDSIFKVKLIEMNKRAFKTKVLYFNENPEELIGIDRYLIMYVYNPTLSSKVLSGRNVEITEKERNRIFVRIQKLLIEFQCEKGKIESFKMIEKLKNDS